MHASKGSAPKGIKGSAVPRPWPSPLVALSMHGVVACVAAICVILFSLLFVIQNFVGFLGFHEAFFGVARLVRVRVVLLG